MCQDFRVCKAAHSFRRSRSRAVIIQLRLSMYRWSECKGLGFVVFVVFGFELLSPFNSI